MHKRKFLTAVLFIPVLLESSVLFICQVTPYLPLCRL